MTGLGVCTRRGVLVAAILSLAVAVPAPHARASEDGPRVRVLSEEAWIRTGAGPEYRRAYHARRGEVFEVVGRAGQGDWFEVELQDGTTGWIHGELVFPVARREQDDSGLWSRTWQSIRSRWMAPPAVYGSRIEIGFSAGVLDGEGLFVLRPSWTIDPRFSLALYGGTSPRSQVDLYLAGAGWVLRLIPEATITPVARAEVGGVHLRPKADNFTTERASLATVSVGMGVEWTVKSGITVHVDARHWTLFDADHSSRAQEYSGGLAIFF